MNWLAHSYLGGRDPVDRIANLSGDFVRGIPLESLDPTFRAGVRAHRAIDAFTDAHPRVAASRARVKGVLGRFAGPLVDVFYDHFLARDWSRFTAAGTAPLREFVDEVYDALHAHCERLPPRLRAATPFMIRDDWLASYRTLGGVTDILRRMEGRLRRPIPLAEGVAILRGEEAAFGADFAAFFPDLCAYVAQATGGADGLRR